MILTPALPSPPALPPRAGQRPIEDPLLAYLGSLSPRSRVTVRERLQAVARLMQVPFERVAWHELRAHHVEWIRQALTERGVAPSTVNVTLSALKGIAQRARNLNLMTPEEYDRIRDVRGAKGEREPAGRSATAGEIEALVRACLADRRPAGVRDVAMLGVLYIGGIRRAELANLQLGDYTPHAAGPGQGEQASFRPAHRRRGRGGGRLAEGEGRPARRALRAAHAEGGGRGRLYDGAGGLQDAPEAGGPGWGGAP